ncbi:MAG: hypothetical protein AAF658_05360, partial [Myxococcota bacterium]
MDGVCVELNDETACDDTNLSGVCPGSEVCVGGGCVPIDTSNACTPTRVDGLCSSGLVCDRGFCIPLRDLPCAPDQTEGFCPAGQSCSTVGGCEVAACSPTHPFGACPVDERCVDGACAGLPCSALHPNGVCEPGLFCASSASCIPVAQCASNDDCTAVEICSLPPEDDSAIPVCIGTNTCRFDGDCELVVGQGFECDESLCAPRDVCSDDDECTPDSFCSAGGRCRDAGGCDLDDDCSNGEFCSVETNLCTPVGECRADGDCDEPLICSRVPVGATCIMPGTCLGVEDCRPGEACEANACEQQVALECTTNTLSDSCDPGVTVCCPAGEQCCESGEVCSLAVESGDLALCIPQGRCRSEDDCGPGFSCSELFVCEAQDAVECASSAECGVGESCKSSGICLGANQCITSSDCQTFEFCGPSFECEPVPTPVCDFQEAPLGTVLAPNVMLVMDRSASMNICGRDAFDTGIGACGFPGDDGNCCTGQDQNPGVPSPACDELACSDSASAFPEPGCSGECVPDFCEDGSTACTDDGDCAGIGAGRCETARPCSTDADCLTSCTDATDVRSSRWNQAIEGVASLLTDQQDQVAFGLTRYPAVDSASACGLACNLFSCTDLSVDSGMLDVAVGLGTRGAIDTLLTSTSPGGGTPTAPTLRSILARADLGGLDATDRGNSIVLVTDGLATSDDADIRSCQAACDDSMLGGSETDVDCGGLCPPCAAGLACEIDLDCANGARCPDGTCRPATCFDEQLDSGETALDCGGPCPACNDEETCVDANDCLSGICTSGVCQTASCTDGVVNQNETGPDCGGVCDATCADGLACSAEAVDLLGASTDCTSGVCQESVCRPAECGDGTQNGNETGTDCGGSDCGACPLSGGCVGVDDCQAGLFCDAGSCDVDTCANGVLDAGELDVDCGGSCDACPDGFACQVDGDCQSGECFDCVADIP